MISRMRLEQAGSIAVEVAVVAPALVALLLLVVAAGRISQMDGDVQRAAGAAARAASLQLDDDSAIAAAREAAEANLAASRSSCERLDVSIDLSGLKAGGAVSATVRCSAPMGELSLLGVPGHRTFAAGSVAVVDRYRGGGR